MNDYMDEPRGSGTAMKVVLIIITVIAVIAAVAMGLLFYNAKSNIDSYKERNEALSQSYKEAQAEAERLKSEQADYEQKITELSKELADAQEQLNMMIPAVNDPDAPDGEQSGAIIDLSNNKDLSVKPSEYYDEGVAYTVSAKGLNIRSGPNTTYKQLASVGQNTTVTAYAEDGDWLLVEYKDNAYGWVKSSYVTKK